MKKPKITTEKSAPQAKTEQTVEAVATEAKLKKPSLNQNTAKKSQAVTPKPAPKAKIEQPVAVAAPETKLKIPSSVQKAPKKAKAVTSKPVAAAPETPVLERVGLTAGSIWRYLSENGVTPAAKLVRELPEEEKIIQRSIGWLAQEGKITLDTIEKVEIIGLKN